MCDVKQSSEAPGNCREPRDLPVAFCPYSHPRVENCHCLRHLHGCGWATRWTVEKPMTQRSGDCPKSCPLKPPSSKLIAPEAERRRRPTRSRSCPSEGLTLLPLFVEVSLTGEYWDATRASLQFASSFGLAAVASTWTQMTRRATEAAIVLFSRQSSGFFSTIESCLATNIKPTMNMPVIESL